MTTSWCIDCYQQEREIEGLDEEFPQISFVKEDADERPDLAVRYTPQIYPSISLISKSAVIGGTYGLVKRDKIREILTQAMELIEGKGKPVTLPKISAHKLNVNPHYVMSEILRNCEGYYDWINGGFEREPKFVSTEVLKLFLKFDDFYHTSMVVTTLDNAISNLWDDGFYIYSITNDWKTPYKAKLYDFNAELVISLLEAYKKVGDDSYLDYAVKTAEWMIRNRRSDGLFPNAEVMGKVDNRAFLNVNSVVGESLIRLYKETDDSKYLDIAKELYDKIVSRKLTHNLDNSNSPLFLIDIARFLNFSSYLKKDNKEILKISSNYESDRGAYYDVTLEHANEERIGRYTFLYDNSILALAFINLGMINEAKKILDSLMESFIIYTYFNQAIYALALGEIYGLFPH